MSTNETKASRTVGKWLPVGTSQEDATKILKKHGFTYNPEATGSVSPLGLVAFDKNGPIHTWCVLLHFENGEITTTNPTVQVFYRQYLYLNFGK
ncbi:MAG TPA: hypothetical protein VG077_03695 [Verrucomicrobiae bacterium]|nr:hypothetical protein [Verrucomicrobiae bacterium]